MNYTLVITSCGRPHLLQQTWNMFHASRDIQQSATIIIDDGPMECPEWIPKHSVTWISNGTRRGQIFSVDKAYDQIKTEYIFHCEDDWGFHDTGYMGESFELLEKYPEILQVWLRGIQSPADMRDRASIHRCEPHPVHPFTTACYYWKGWEGGFSFNPGLRRLSDYKRLGSYGKHCGYDPRGCGEWQLGRIYNQLGYVAAILPPEYTYHIGDESHIDRKSNPAPAKILIAIPTADQLDYSEFRVKQKQMYGKTWAGGMSGLQIDGPNVRRKAVEETWWKDFTAYENVIAKFFTGRDFDCSDKFIDLPEKNRRICAWALDNDFDVLVRFDDDTFVHTDRLMRQTIEFAGDYAGSDCGGFAIGGAGIWLSRNAMEIVATSSWPAGEWRDDAFIGEAMKAHRITMYPMPGCAGENQLLGKPITEHPVSPERMREMYAAA